MEEVEGSSSHTLVSIPPMPASIALDRQLHRHLLCDTLTDTQEHEYTVIHTYGPEQQDTYENEDMCPKD